MDKIDFKELVKQEPDFKEYLEKCAYLMIKDNEEVISFIYATYCSGLTPERFEAMFKMMNRVNNGKND